MGSLIRVFTSYRMALVLLMGFSSGLPLALTGSTLQAWLATENTSLAVIGFFSLVGIPYTLKFLWSPLLDRFTPPFGGRRRGWLFIIDLALIASIAAMALLNPANQPWLFALLAATIVFFSASQDIVLDAFRTELLRTEEYGAGSGVYIMGYRLAMLTSGSLALILADHYSWHAVYLFMAALMGIGLLIALISPEPEVVRKPLSLREAVVEPLTEFLKRPGVFEVILFIVLYKLDAVIASALQTPFLLQIGFTKTDIGAITKVFGLIATITGTLSGGALMVRLGLYRSLWAFGIAQSVAGFSFMALAAAGHSYPLMATAIAAENFFSGMGTAAYIAFLMNLCDKRYTATQYALLSSLMALTRVVAGSPTGRLAEMVGWEMYFLISVLVSIPALLLLFRYKYWMKYKTD